MTLDQLPSGQTRTVLNVHGDPALRERLVELGFGRGARVTLVRRALLGDPLHVRVRAGAFAMRGSEASCIELREEEA